MTDPSRLVDNGIRRGLPEATGLLRSRRSLGHGSGGRKRGADHEAPKASHLVGNGERAGRPGSQRVPEYDEWARVNVQGITTRPAAGAHLGRGGRVRYRSAS